MIEAKVWITGVGAATPLGHDVHEIADRLLSGASGIRTIDTFSVDDHPSRIAGQIVLPECPSGFDVAEFQELAPLDQTTVWCVATALRDAGLWNARHGLRIGIVVGSAAEWANAWEMDYQHGGRAIFRSQKSVPPLSERTRRSLGLHGPIASLSAACASGNFALALGRRWLRLGWADIVLAGACDLAVTPLTLAAFGNLRALSRRNEEPTRASRPFDADRDGFVMSEGGAFFVLEPEEFARKRGATPHAELAGCGASSDAYHMVIPSPDPSQAMAAMQNALSDAGLRPDQIDYVNAHATSTPAGDVAEAKALSGVFGSAIDTVPVSSTKSMTGHLLTAAAAVEAVACIIALKRNAVPPTINLENPDPACRLFHVANHALEKPVRATMSNSFGFGGSNTSLILKAA